MNGNIGHDNTTLTTTPAENSQKNQRLELIISRYNNEHPVVKTRSQKLTLAEPILAKNFNELSSEDQRAVLEKAQSIDYTNLEAILSFDTKHENPLSQVASAIIKKLSTSQVFFQNPAVTKLVTLLKKDYSVSCDSIPDFNNTNIFSAMRYSFYTRSMKKKFNKSIEGYKTLGLSIQAILVLLVNNYRELTENSKFYSKLFTVLSQSFREIEINLFSLRLLLKRASEDLSAQKSDTEKATYSRYVDLISRKIHTLETSAVITHQSIVQLSLLIRNNEAISETYNELINITIPLWKWQYAIAISTASQQHALNIHKAIRSISSKASTNTSSSAKGSMTKVHDEMVAAYTALEDLACIQHHMDETLLNISTLSEKTSTETTKSMQSLMG